ncbi:MAG TPA: hypothetical protein VMV86_03725, partial [Methanosarcinales archaeon]|nr:hypothetical protein [Methanosarcinales archaeon]
MSYKDIEKNVEAEKQYVKELKSWINKFPTGSTFTTSKGVETTREKLISELSKSEFELGELRKKAARVKAIEEEGFKEQISREVSIEFPELKTKPAPKTFFSQIGEKIWDIKEYTTQEQIKKLDKSFGTFGAAKEEFYIPRFTLGEQAMALGQFGEAVFEFGAITLPSYAEQFGFFVGDVGTAIQTFVWGVAPETKERKAAFGITPEGKRKSFGFEWTPFFTGPKVELQKEAVKLGMEIGYIWYPSAKAAYQFVKEIPYKLAGVEIRGHKLGEIYPSDLVVKGKVQPFKTKVDYKTAITIIPEEALYTQKVKFLGKAYQRTLKITGKELEAMKGIGKITTGEIILDDIPTGKKGAFGEVVSIKGPKEFYGETLSYPSGIDDISLQIGALDIKEEAGLYLGSAKKLPKDILKKDVFFTKGFLVSPEAKVTAVATRVEVLKVKDWFKDAEKVWGFKGAGRGTGIAGIKKQFLMQKFAQDYAATVPFLAAKGKEAGVIAAAKGIVGLKDTGTILSGAGMFALKGQKYFVTEEIEYGDLALKMPKEEAGFRAPTVKYDFGLKQPAKAKVSI